jgi:hypothetical protein
MRLLLLFGLSLFFRSDLAAHNGWIAGSVVAPLSQHHVCYSDAGPH